MLLCERVFLSFVIGLVYSEYYNFKLGPRIFKVKSVLIKETMKGIKSNIIGGKLFLNSGAKF